MESLQNVQFKLTILDDHFLMIFCSERTALSTVHEKRRIMKKLLKKLFLSSWLEWRCTWRGWKKMLKITACHVCHDVLCALREFTHTSSWQTEWENTCYRPRSINKINFCQMTTWPSSKLSHSLSIIYWCQAPSLKDVNHKGVDIFTLRK